MWAKLEPVVSQIRGKIVAQTFLSNIQRLVESSDYARERLVAARQTVARLRDRAQAAAPKP